MGLAERPEERAARAASGAAPRRILAVDLARARWGAGGVAPLATALPARLAGLATSDALGGLGLAYAALRAIQDGATREPRLALAVGDAVRRGVPTAARASLLARVPSTARLADGQVGGDLGARLAELCELLLVFGALAPTAADDADGVAAGREGGGDGAAIGIALILDATGAARLERVAGLRGAAPAAKRAALCAHFGRTELAGLCVGPAGEVGAPLANVASLGVPTSFVGRGGLGLAFGATGLAALVVLAAPRPARRDEAANTLRRALERSPRLIARAEGGTLELAEDLAARGASGASAAADAAREAQDARTGRHGCKGCPTQCGWVFDGGAGPLRGGRFGALAHLASLGALGAAAADPADGLSAARAVLARCDDLGLDAKGARFALLRLLAGAALDVNAALELLARGGARAEQLAALLDSRAPDQRDDPVARLARCVAGVGRDPMRVGLALADADEARVARALAPLPWPPRPGGAPAEPSPDAGAGRFVWWHECFALALDATGFCAFSAAGLLADGVLTLPELAQELGVDGGLIEAGAALVAARHALAPPHARLARGPDAADLEAPSALPEYRLVAGLDDAGAPRAAHAQRAVGSALARAARALAGRDQGAAGREATDAEAAEVAQPTQSRRAPAAAAAVVGNVELVGGAALARRLGGALRVALPLPAPARAVLAAAEAARPEARGWLLRGDELVPAVLRRGARLHGDDLVHDLDRLDLVLVVAGG